jgi:hypothetical protein
MMEESQIRKREIRDDDENNLEDMSGYQKSGVQIA